MTKFLPANSSTGTFIVTHKAKKKANAVAFFYVFSFVFHFPITISNPEAVTSIKKSWQPFKYHNQRQ